MTKKKIRLITIISFFALFALTFGLAVGALFPARKASAITYSMTSIFSKGNGVDIVESEEIEGKKYIQFTMQDDGKVYYRRDLALRWFEAPQDKMLDGDGATEKFLSMTFAFSEINFEAFTLTFEGAEENISKEAKSVNSLRFIVKEGKLKVAIVNASEQEIDKDKIDEELADHFADIDDATKDITVTLANSEQAGEFLVNISYGDEEVALSEEYNRFTNIGSNYLEYRASTATTPNTPITFTADLPAAQEGQAAGSMKLLMKELNGQSFALVDGVVQDNAPPVLVLNEAVYAYTLGRRFSLTYEAIDVCDDSVSVTRYYYMAKEESKDEEEAAEADALRHQKPEKDDYKSLSPTTYFIASDDAHDVEYVSIRFLLDDGTNHFYKCDKCSNVYSDLNDKAFDKLESDWPCPNTECDGTKSDYKAQSYYVYLTWYAANDSVVYTCNEGTEDEFDCIVVNRDKGGPEYVGLVADEESKTNIPEEDSEAFAEAVEAYRNEVKQVADKASAGSGAYFYLPSLRGLISSDYADYRNLRFSIYYRKGRGSSSSATSLRYNALRFEITTPDIYSFRVIASDAAGNAMKLYNTDGKLVEVTASNVWEIEGIPEFTFEVGYSGATVEEQKSAQTGYLDSTYTISSFDIVAVPGYETEYSLYRFDASNLPEGESIPNYDDMWKNPETYFNKYYKEGDDEKSVLIEISAYNSDIDEDDEAWSRTDNAYAWNPEASSLTFCPQEATYYFVKLVITEPDYAVGNTVTAYQVIRVSNPIDTVTAKSNWFRNNVTSVVLFSISAVLAVAIVVLFVVKPSDKKVEEVDLTKLKGGKKNNNK